MNRLVVHWGKVYSFARRGASSLQNNFKSTHQVVMRTFCSSKPEESQARPQAEPQVKKIAKETLEYLRCPILKAPLKVISLLEGDFLEATKGDIKVRYPYPKMGPGSDHRYIKLRSIDAFVVT